MRTKFKAWAEPYINEHTEVMLKGEDLATKKDFVLEIGSGKGQFLLLMSQKFPSLDFVGIEKNVTCCGFTAKKLVENEVGNAKLIFDDAERVLLNVKDESIDTIFLNFSDPWPKKRHTKRRLTSEKFLNEYYRVIKAGGNLIIKTDNDDLFAYSKEMFEGSKFSVVSCTEDYDGKEEFDAITEYEESFRSVNKNINRMVLKK
ncbi:MAG: tRNA (guanosine(46)-N7)-methyltransferase TrmB [Bacilli bacterium]|nr:tRNA (guanosine(46)-N7)-methyltransferase TrmB [Bacilli bacterium]